MPVTRTKLAAVVADLKSRKGFTWASNPLNAPGDQLDVFVDVDELGTFRPEDAGDAPWYLAWTRDANEGAFDSRGRLVKPLTMRCGGPLELVQDKFARAGWIVRAEPDEASKQSPYGGGGLLVLPPDADRVAADLRTLHETFAALNARGAIAFTCVYGAQSAGWENVAARDPKGTRTAVFWTDHGHAAFDPEGDLVDDLRLYWRGDAGRIARALEGAGFLATAPASENVGFAVGRKNRKEPGRAKVPAPVLEAPAATRASPRKTKNAAGPLPELNRFRSPDRKPVAALALLGDGTLAVAQESDMRGPPERVLAIVASETGEVRHAFPTDSHHASVPGLVALRDGRLVFGIADLVERGGWCNSVWCWDATDASTVVIDREDHERSVGNVLVSIDREERTISVCKHDGVVLRTVAPRAGHEWRAIGHLERPPCFYPYARLAPDGGSLLCGEDDRGRLQRVALPSGKVLWEYEGSVDTMRKLTFDPASKHILFRRGLRRVLGMSAKNGRDSQPALEEIGRGARAFTFAPDGDVLVLGRVDGTVSLLRYPRLESIAEARIFDKGDVTALSFDPSGQRLAIGSHRGEVVVAQWLGGARG